MKIVISGVSRNATSEEEAAILAQREIDGAIAAPIPTTVSSRQFKLQLLASGLLDMVDAYIAAQPRAVQVSYENSGSFVRSEPMMQAGFAALGKSPAEVDAFFAAAAQL